MRATISRCSNCKQLRACHRRGLCSTCYRRPEVRTQHPRWQQFRDFNGAPALPDRATAELPGSAAKVEVLKGRARRGEALHHPADCFLLPDRPAPVPRWRAILPGFLAIVVEARVMVEAVLLIRRELDLEAGQRLPAGFTLSRVEVAAGRVPN